MGVAPIMPVLYLLLLHNYSNYFADKIDASLAEGIHSYQVNHESGNLHKHWYEATMLHGIMLEVVRIML